MTPRKHKHRLLIQQWLDDDSLVVECKHESANLWSEILDPSWGENYDYRFKPRTIRIGEFDVPEPLRVEPAIGSEVFLATLCGEEHVIWSDNPVKKELLRRGLIHETRDAAHMHARALISLTEVK